MLCFIGRYFCAKNKDLDKVEQLPNFVDGLVCSFGEIFPSEGRPI